MNDLREYRFVEISRQEATVLVIRNHYLHSKCPISWCWGVKYEGRTVGVLTVGKPASWSLCSGAVGESKVQFRDPESRTRHVYELNRLWIKDGLPENLESRFIGWCLRQLKKQDPLIVLVSYADGAQGHVGYVYQATNWSYTGLSTEFVDPVVQAGKTVKVPRTLKHRYLWFAMPRWKGLMKWPTLPYPKTVAAQPLADSTHAEQQQSDQRDRRRRRVPGHEES